MIEAKPKKKKKKKKKLFSVKFSVQVFNNFARRGEREKQNQNKTKRVFDASSSEVEFYREDTRARKGGGGTKNDATALNLSSFPKKEKGRKKINAFFSLFTPSPPAGRARRSAHRLWRSPQSSRADSSSSLSSSSSREKRPKEKENRQKKSRERGRQQSWAEQRASTKRRRRGPWGSAAGPLCQRTATKRA